MKQADAWLKPDDTVGHDDSDNTDGGNSGNSGNDGNHLFTFSPFHSFSPRFHLKKAKNENENDEQNNVHSLKGDSNDSIYIGGA
jgi:hypothetical protein